MLCCVRQSCTLICTREQFLQLTVCLALSSGFLFLYYCSAWVVFLCQLDPFLFFVDYIVLGFVFKVRNEIGREERL